MKRWFWEIGYSGGAAFSILWLGLVSLVWDHNARAFGRWPLALVWNRD